MKQYTIGQLSKLTALSTKAIRFYEKLGLIASAARSENGYRFFDTAACEQLKLIKYARDLDLPIPEIKKLMSGCDAHGGCKHTKNYILTEIKQYLAVLDQKIDRARSLQKKLRDLSVNVSREYNENSCTYCCNILQQLIKVENQKGGERTMKNSCTCCGEQCQCDSCSCDK